MIFLPLLFTTAWANEPSDWTTLAHRLTGEGQGVRAEAISRLKRIPRLDAKLKQALVEPKAYLALDVIVALGLTSLWDDLVRTSEKDRSGFFYLALDSLVTDANAGQLGKIYRARLRSQENSPAARVVIVDSLLRMNERLSTAELSSLLLEDPAPEVRSAALYYARAYFLRKDWTYLPIFKLFLEGRLSRQLKAQALALAGELPDLPVDVKATCEKLSHRP